MSDKSLFRVFTGRATAAIGCPVIITSAHIYRDDLILSEHYVILPKRIPSLVKKRLLYHGSLSRLPPGLFSLDHVMQNEIRCVKAVVENLITDSLSDVEKSCLQLFVPYQLEIMEPRLLISFLLVGQLSEELRAIERDTRCDALKDYLSDINRIEPFTVKEHKDES